jgi:hypothetical protein
MRDQQEHEKWIASEFVTGPQPGYQEQTVMGKFAGGQYQYEITLQDNKTWRLFPKTMPSEPIYGATPQDCLTQLKQAGLE